MVDVILADAKLTPRACCVDCTLDWAAGSSENDFELTTADSGVMPERGWFFWVDGSNVGGRIVDRRSVVEGQSSTSTWIGTAWQGMLADKILQPDAGKDYLTVSGTVSSVLSALVRRVGLDGVFTVSPGDKDPTLQSYQFKNPRYVDAYTGIMTMVQSCGLRLDFSANADRIVMSARGIAHFEDSVDSDIIDFTAETSHRTVNHLIGLGQEELRNRLVSHWYADANGNVSRTQTLKGVDEITEIYDYSCAEQKTLDDNTKKRLQELQSGGKVDVTIGDELADRIMIGDQITARDHNTGLAVTSTVTKQIVKIDGDMMTSTFEVGQQDTAVTSHSSGSGGTASGGDVAYAAGNGITIANGTISAEVNKSDLESVRSTANAASSLASGLNESIGKANTTANAAKDSADQARSLASERVKTITAVAPLSAIRNGNTVALSAPNTLPAPTSLTSTDLNTLKTGWGAYWAGGGNTCSHKPSGVGHFGLIVQRTALGWTTQLLTDPQTGTIWRRTWNSGSWDEWKALAEDRDATPTVHGLMSSGDKKKLDSIQDGANAYTLPVASSGTLGGVKPDGTTIHITADGTISAANLTDAEASFLTAHPVGSIIMLREGIDPARWGGEWRELPSTGACVWERIN